MDNQNTHRVALVTGASGGIGRAVAERLARDGMSVVVHYAGNAGRAEETVASITGRGGRALAARADVADADQVEALFDTAEKAFGGVDVVAHTAGVLRLARVAEQDLDDLDDLLRTNVRGTFAVAREAARRVRRGGAVITFSSSVVKLAFPGYAGYAASKAAVDALTPVLAGELRGRD
ncbi:SDR family NAD(P)-dependent oxidoreductase, partial [Nocardiopsis tropica]|nr:SDR family NAD(P)-dependent oxidoreductase [Nocardiopsis tropica]